MTFTASSCPMTRRCRASSMRSSLSRSPSSILDTGIPVHLETTSAISSSVTDTRSRVVGRSSPALASLSCFSSSGMRPYWSSDMRCRSPARWAVSNSRRARSRASLICCEPWTMAFSAFRTSSRSEYCFSSSVMSLSSLASRSMEASSVSFLSASRSIFSCTSLRSSRSMASGLESISIRIRLAASSTRSMALSGSCRSVM